MNGGGFDKIREEYSGKSVLAAYSGGTDSSALVYLLRNTPGVKLTAVTVKGPHVPEFEIASAESFCKKIGVKHHIIEINPLKDKNFLQNDNRRCYYCKKAMFIVIKQIAADIGADKIVDGTNNDDISDFRPGITALNELGVESPFKTYGIGKFDIIEYLRENGWESKIHHPNACLVSRIPFGGELSEEILQRIDAAEAFITSLGVSGTRCRVYEKIARIEANPEDFQRIVVVHDRIAARLRLLGFEKVTLDLDGYRRGGANWGSVVIY